MYVLLLVLSVLPPSYNSTAVNNNNNNNNNNILPCLRIYRQQLNGLDNRGTMVRFAANATDVPLLQSAHTDYGTYPVSYAMGNGVKAARA
jgi:hypothetical protein